MANSKNVDELIEDLIENGGYTKKEVEKNRNGLGWIYTWLSVTALLVIFTFFVPCSWFWTILFGVASLVLFVPTVYLGFAKADIFFTLVNEGSVKVVTAGGANFVKALIQYKDRTLSRDWDVVNLPGVVQPSFFGLGGLRFYGIWPLRQIYKYSFSWASIDQNGDKKEHVDEILDYIMVKDMLYWFSIKEAEDQDLLPLNIEGLINVRITNPYKALFGPQNWLKITIALIQTLLRGEASEKDYKKLVAERALLGDRLMNDPDTLLLIRELEANYGVKILKIEVKDVDPPANFRELTMKAIIAKQERRAIIIASKAEAARVKNVYDAVEAQGDTGRLVRTLEMLEKSKDKWILSPDILDAVRGLFGGAKRP